MVTENHAKLLKLWSAETPQPLRTSMAWEHIDIIWDGNQDTISGHGRDMLYQLESRRRGHPDRPLIFVVHSLGSLVLKDVRSFTFKQGTVMCD